MDRQLTTESVEGEIALVIDYVAGTSLAVDVLQGAMQLILSLDKLDRVLLSSVDTNLEPVSILNDVQHSSLKMMLARGLRGIPDEPIKNLDWKKWIGGLLVAGKYKLLKKLEADTPAIQQVLIELESDYKNAPTGLIGYTPPTVNDVQSALDGINKARSAMPNQAVTIQTEFGDILLPEVYVAAPIEPKAVPANTKINRGTEFFKVKAVDMLGESQWTMLRHQKLAKVDMLHRKWLEEYRQRLHILLPGDSLECDYEETILYDANLTELERKLAITQVRQIITPPVQKPLLLS